MKKYFIMVFLLVLVGCSVDTSSVTQSYPEKEFGNKTDMTEKTDTPAERTKQTDDTVLAGTTAPYKEFSKAAYDKALSENKLVLLNFYANWCPTCKAEEPDAFAAFDQLEVEGVVGFRVNYKDSDTDEFEKDLAIKFGVPYQHTKVIIKNGKQVVKSPETWDSQRYIDEITRQSG